MPEYHNPDPLIHLIGPANEAPAEIEGVPITSLVDLGACMSAMVKSFAEELQLEIKPLCCDMDQSDTIGKIELIPSFVLSSNNTHYKNDIQ